MTGFKVVMYGSGSISTSIKVLSTLDAKPAQASCVEACVFGHDGAKKYRVMSGEKRKTGKEGQSADYGKRGQKL